MPCPSHFDWLIANCSSKHFFGCMDGVTFVLCGAVYKGMCVCVCGGVGGVRSGETTFVRNQQEKSMSSLAFSRS